MSINAGTVYSELVLDVSRYDQGLRQAEQQMNSFASNLGKIGKNIEKAGKEWTTKVTLPIVGLGAAATKASIDFESAFAGVIKTVDATDKQLDTLEKGIKDMSKEIPASAVAIAGVAEAAGQLGIKTENILSFSRVMIDLGEATNLSANDAATSLARLANITGMSQQDFDKLGSTIVALGNNLATTEAEIVAMGLRLAGAGSQIGLTEAQIMSFAGALSSVGIEAEAGGSAFSKVMVDMQLAVETNSDRLKDFANVAGISANEFSKAFKEDAGSAIISFIQGLGSAEERGLSAIKVLDDMGITEIRLRDSLLRASGASEVFTDALELGTNAWEENNALTKEAEQRYKTTASQLQVAKNYLVDAGIIIGDIVVPHLVSLAEKVKNVSEWFSNLNPKTQETIVKLAGLVAAVGPVLLVSGKMATSISSIIGLFAKFSAASTAATTATTALTGSAATAAGAGGLGALGAGFGATLTAIAPWALGIAGAGVAAYGLYKYLSQDAIPAVDLFGNSVSESTQKAVGGFLELNDKATVALNQLNWSGQAVTGEMASSITETFSSMKDQIIQSLDEQHTESYDKMRTHFENSSALTEQEEANILQKIENSNEAKKIVIESSNARINEIMQRASDERRELTKEEQEEINRLQLEMKETGIKVLSETELESKAILERMRSQAGEITAHQAAEVVKNSLEQKEKAIQNAEDQYNEVVKEIIKQRDELGIISEEQAKKLIDEAKKQKDGAIREANTMHHNVVFEAQQQAEEQVKFVDWTTGEIKSKWSVMVDDAKTWGKNMVEGLWQGMSSAGSWISTKVSEFAGGVADTFKNFFGIQSPSRLMMEYGRYIDEGLAIGIEKNSSKAIKEAEKMAQATVKQFDTLGNAVITALRKRYQEEEKVQLDSLRKQTENVRRETDERIKEYDRELAAKLKLLDDNTNEELSQLQDQINGINDKTKQEEKELEEQEYQRRLAAKEKELIEAKSAEEQLKIIDELNQLKADRERKLLLESRQLQIEELRSEMDRIRAQTQEKRNTLQIEYEEKKRIEIEKSNATIAALAEEMEATKIHFAKLLEEDRIQAEARRLILDENNKELVELLGTYNPKWQDAGRSFGENLLEGLNSTKQSIQKAVSEILSMVGQTEIANARLNNQNEIIIQAKRDWEEASKNNDTRGMELASKTAEAARASGGTIGANDTLAEALRKIGKNAHGTNFWRGGLTWVGEQGPELIELPKGSKVHSNQKSVEMTKGANGGITQNINIYSPTPLSPSEVARKNLQASRQLAMEWGV